MSIHSVPTVLVLVGIWLGSASCARPAPPIADLTECASGDLPVPPGPTRQRFFREVLYPAATVVTPRFDDYTEGSYHADKFDLVTALDSAATACGLDLEATVVVGPLGPLWAYHVLALVRDGSYVRANLTVMPHARITQKGTRVLTRREASAFLATMTQSPLLHPGLPVRSQADTSALDFDFGYDLAISRSENSELQFWHARLRQAKDTAEVNRLLQVFSDLTKPMLTTYGHNR